MLTILADITTLISNVSNGCYGECFVLVTTIAKIQLHFTENFTDR